MATRYRTKAFILQKGNRAEVDSSITAFSKDFGILQLNATSGRKIVSKLRGGTEPFIFTELEFIRGKAYNRVVDALSLRAHRNIKKDLIALRCVSAISELLIKSMKGEMPDARVWNLVEKSFSVLEASSAKPITLYYYFLWNLLSLLGYTIEVSNCSLCKNEIQSVSYIDFTEGGITCNTCSVAKDNPISLKTLEMVQFLYSKPLFELNSLKIDRQFHDFSMKYRSHIFQIMQ